MTNWPLIHLCEARMWYHRRKYDYAHERLVEHEAEVRRSRRANHPAALRLAEELVRKWGPIEGHEAREVHRYAAKIAELRPKESNGIPWAGEGVCVPKTAWNPYRRKIANWIARELLDAVNHHGAEGVVTSGERTYAEQAVLYHRYRYEGGNIAAPPGESNHEGFNYAEPWRSGGKKGAVDWERAESLAAALRRKPGRRLFWAEESGLADHPHFSGTGH